MQQTPFYFISNHQRGIWDHKTWGFIPNPQINLNLFTLELIHN
jgi:hypothetical protein